MKYKQEKEYSRLYEYGDGKEFASKEEAKEAVEKRRYQKMTEASLDRMYSKVDIEIIEKENTIQLVATKKVPIVFEENQE